jgi:hypothetical protein
MPIINAKSCKKVPTRRSQILRVLVRKRQKRQKRHGHLHNETRANQNIGTLVVKWYVQRAEPVKGLEVYDDANNLGYLTGLPSAVLPGQEPASFLGIDLCLHQFQGHSYIKIWVPDQEIQLINTNDQL